MGLPEDQGVIATAGALVKTLQGVFGTPAGYRPAHANGRLTKGTFTPTKDAAALSCAPHFNNASTPIVVRFSSSTGIPNIPDTDSNANPRGMAIRFVLSEDGHRHTDIVTHSSAFFPMSTGEGFLKMLGAIGSGTIGKFLEENASAAAFVQDPKPFPASLANEQYFGINAFKLIDTHGKATFVRYRVIPEASLSPLSDEQVKSKSSTYLFEELADHLRNGSMVFKLLAQIAEDGDPTNDCTKHWPESRRLVELGTISLNEVLSIEHSKAEQQRIIYDPIPRVDGVEASDDPLLDMRAAMYLISGRERRAAPSTS